MKRITPLFLAGLVGLAACSDRNPADLGTSVSDPSVASFSSDAAEDAEFVPGQIIVRFRPGAARNEIAQANRAKHKSDLLLERTEILEVPIGEELEIANNLKKNPNVEFAEPDYIYRVGPCEVSGACDLPDGQFFHYKWDLQNNGSINDLALGWGTVTSGTKGADIKWTETYDHLGASWSGSAVIAILDTGIRSTHQAFAGKIIAGRRFTGVTILTPATNFTDDHGHGTHVAGTAAAHGNVGVPGVAYSPNVKLLVGKVCNSAGQCPSSATAEAIIWAADNGANVINMSLGSPGWAPDGSGSAAQQAALQYANSKNVLSVCATGNDHGKPEYSNTNGGIGYPARFPECMAVGSTNWNNAKASYSNFGPQIEISAPGGDGNPQGHPFSQILAATRGSDGSYGWMAGTSMATPQVAGLAAMLRATGMTDMQQVRQRIKETADDLGPAGWDTHFGVGRINVYRAITGVDTKAPPEADAGPGGNGRKGIPIQFDGGKSFDPNGKSITYAWDFGDGNTGTGISPTNTYLRSGTYTVTLTVTDESGLTDDATTQVVIENIVPGVGSFGGATLLQGETYTASGAFADADPDTWTATVNYGDGSGVQALALSGKNFVLSRRYTAAGSFTVAVTITDDENGSGTGTALVTVQTPQQGITPLIATVGNLGLAQGNVTALNAPLNAAVSALNSGNRTAATQQMEAFNLQVDALVKSKQLTEANGQMLKAEANRVIASINSL